MTFLLALLISFTFSSAPVVESSPVVDRGPEIALNLKPPLISGNSIKLGYEIPYPGYIEFHLFDPDGNKIWQNFGVKEKGEHVQALRRDKMDAGATYSFEFWYKGERYPGKFTNN